MATPRTLLLRSLQTLSQSSIRHAGRRISSAPQRSITSISRNNRTYTRANPTIPVSSILRRTFTATAARSHGHIDPPKPGEEYVSPQNHLPMRLPTSPILTSRGVPQIIRNIHRQRKPRTQARIRANLLNLPLGRTPRRRLDRLPLRRSLPRNRSITPTRASSCRS